MIINLTPTPIRNLVFSAEIKLCIDLKIIDIYTQLQ